MGVLWVVFSKPCANKTPQLSAIVHSVGVFVFVTVIDGLGRV